MTYGRVTTERNVYESVSRSATLVAPAAGTVFFTIAASDLPSGYYRFDTITGLVLTTGGVPAATDMRNFAIAVGSRGDFFTQAVPNASNKTEGWITLNGTESIVCKVGPNAATNNTFYSMAVFLTKRN